MAILKLNKEGKPAASPQKPSVPKAQSTPLAEPIAPPQPSAPGAAPDPVLAPASFLTMPDNVNWSDPKLDTTKKDSLGSEKTDKGEFGPKGNKPPDVMTDAERQDIADKREARMRQNMADTSKVDSLGNKKGRFQTTPQGNDSHGMKIPDAVDYSKPVEAIAPQVGPRGVGAPQDTYHGVRPVKK